MIEREFRYVWRAVQIPDELDGTPRVAGQETVLQQREREVTVIACFDPVTLEVDIGEECSVWSEWTDIQGE